MATGVIATERRQLSEVLKGYTKFEDDSAINYCFYTGEVGAASGTAEPIGTPVVWVNANSRFEVYVDQVIATVASTTSPLPNGARVGVLVGTKEGRGNNKEAIDLTAGAANATILFRGPAAVVDTAGSGVGDVTSGINDGIQWAASSGAERAAFNKELETQGIAVITSATASNPNFV